jgi:hypothetical protein
MKAWSQGASQRSWSGRQVQRLGELQGNFSNVCPEWRAISTLVRIISGLHRSNAERFGAAAFRAAR